MFTFEIKEKGNTTIGYAILIGSIGLAAIGGIALLGTAITAAATAGGNLLATPTPIPAAIGVITDTTSITSTLPMEPVPTAAPTPTSRPRDEANDDTDDKLEDDERSRHQNYFFDDFSDGDAHAWFTSAGGDWGLQQGRYCAGPVLAEHRTFAGDPSWTNYIVTARAKLSQGDGYGLYFRATNINQVNAYVFQYDPGFGSGAFLFRQVVNGNERYPFALAYAPGYNWYGRERTVSIEVRDDTFTVAIDGKQVLQATHTEFKKGQIGLRTWWSSQVCFDDVSVTPLFSPDDVFDRDHDNARNGNEENDEDDRDDRDVRNRD